MTATPNLPPEFTSGNSISVERATITRERMAEINLAAYQAGRNAGLVAAHAVLDDVGAKLQQAHDDEDDSYWAGVGATVQAGEEAIRALKSETREAS